KKHCIVHRTPFPSPVRDGVPATGPATGDVGQGRRRARLRGVRSRRVRRRANDNSKEAQMSATAWRRTSMALAVGVAVLGLAGPAMAQDNVLEIGVLGVMSGPAASWGLVNKYSAEATAQMYNEQG